MSDKNTTSKLPKYKKTIDTTGFGLSCTTEYGFDDEGWFHHSYTYTYKKQESHRQRSGRRGTTAIRLAHTSKRIRLLP